MQAWEPATEMNPHPPITLRRATPKDAAAFVRINGHPAVQPNLMQLPYGSEERWLPMLEENVAPGGAGLVLVAERGGEIVGNAGLHPAGKALRRHHVASIGLAVAAHAQRQGVGRALLGALCEYADRWGQLLRLELTVYADNAGAIALYRQFGFEVEGRHRGYALRDGCYVDALAMARWHPSPPTLQVADP